ncbi:MAG TPA: hypothetical protein VMR50_11910 [Myxococcota bacterium]|nr:hypothetical protein [Myxococcota bacterium]
MTRRALVVGAALAIACGSPWPASYEPIQPVSRPVDAVSLEIDPTPPYIVGPDQIQEILRALDPGLARYGVSVVPAGTANAPRLVGQVEFYDPGVDPEPGRWPHAGTFRARWRLLDAGGVVLGECKTEAKSGVTTLGPSWAEAMEDSGFRLGEFVRGR